ncbi:Hos4p [Sugiyamaella lignohabitans]|uniref:Hos4p n=1 Tax=Sugiyamaella lignohabitans TaxID=796027 RepID=A0A161HGM7_9ASCO|nr:Hos4p [Sugiyamaella lignohabitans]ANB10997.1 Hos4p [Sugiyamaella lignohabitans]
MASDNVASSDTGPVNDEGSTGSGNGNSTSPSGGGSNSGPPSSGWRFSASTASTKPGAVINKRTLAEYNSSLSTKNQATQAKQQTNQENLTEQKSESNKGHRETRENYDRKVGDDMENDDSTAETDDAHEADSSEAETVILEESKEPKRRNLSVVESGNGSNDSGVKIKIRKLSDASEGRSAHSKSNKPLKRLQKRIHVSDDDDDDEYSGDKDDSENENDNDDHEHRNEQRHNRQPFQRAGGASGTLSDSDDWNDPRGRVKSRSRDTSRNSSSSTAANANRKVKSVVTAKMRKDGRSHVKDTDDGKHSRSVSPAVRSGNHNVTASGLTMPVQPIRKDGSPIRDASGRLLLQKLCDKGDFERSKALIEMGVDVNDRDYAGNTALHDAALKGHLNIVELLLDNGAIIDIRSGISDLDTPLIDATSRGHVEVVKLLLSRGADPRIFNAQGKTALDFLSQDDEHFNTLESLLKEYSIKMRNKPRRGSDTGGAEDENNGGNGSAANNSAYDAALHATPGTFPDAYFEGRRGGGNYSDGGYSSSGSQSGHRQKHSHNNQVSHGHNNHHHHHNRSHSPSHTHNHGTGHHTTSGDADESSSLSHDEGSKSSSSHTRRRGGARSQSIRNDLLWMDLTTKTGREQVYRRAADGDLQYVGRSLEEGWQPDADCLVLAAKHGHTEVVGLLLAFGVSSDQLNDEGVTALHETVGRGHMDTIRLLLDSGADPCWVDAQGRSYLDLAKEALGSDDEETILIRDAVDKKKKIPGKKDQTSSSSSSSASNLIKSKSDVEKRRKVSDDHEIPPDRIKKRKLQKVEKIDKAEKAEKAEKSEKAKSRMESPARVKEEPSSDVRSRQLDEKAKAEAAESAARELRKQQEAAAEKKAREEAALAEKKRLEEIERERLKELERKRAEEAEIKRAEEAEKARQAREAERRAEEEKRRIQKEKERELARKREIIAAQKERERKEREFQMLKSLEEEENRRKEKIKREQELEAERLRQLQIEEERKKALEAEQELDRQRMLQLQQEAEARKNFPYAIRMATYGPKQLDEMMSFFPILVHSVVPDTSYFLDIQVSLLLGLPNVHQSCKLYVAVQT